MKKFRTDWSTFGKITGNGEMAGFPASLQIHRIDP